MLSKQSKRDLAVFIGTSVLPNTQRVYEQHWVLWKEFLKNEANQDDPFLRNVSEEEKTSLIGLMMLRRHEAGQRGKAATAFTAGIRMKFSQETLSTDFMDAAVITTTRSSCRLKPSELRERRNSGGSTHAKLPICESILADMRAHMWAGRGWGENDKHARMSYLGCMWGFEMGARVSEYTRPEPGGTDHCVRVNDLTFTVVTEEGTSNIIGSALAATGLLQTAKGKLQVVECRMLAASSKAKVSVKPKLIGRRSAEEAEFLGDLLDFMAHSGATGNEELMSFRRADGSLAALRARSVRDKLKVTCRRNGLPQDYFSSHSLRKGAITQMRALGSSEEDRRDRGNYAPGSQVMNNTYDYATGLGPLAANSLAGGYKPDLTDLKRLIPAVRRSIP